MRANKLLVIAGFLLGALPGLAQTFLLPSPSFPADLKQYLSLTDAQVSAILQMTGDYYQAVFARQERTNQLQNEIAAETLKDPLDPMALGVRYAEIESIRRDMADQLRALRGKIAALLTDPQRA